MRVCLSVYKNKCKYVMYLFAMRFVDRQHIGERGVCVCVCISMNMCVFCHDLVHTYTHKFRQKQARF